MDYNTMPVGELRGCVAELQTKCAQLEHDNAQLANEKSADTEFWTSDECKTFVKLLSEHHNVTTNDLKVNVTQLVTDSGGTPDERKFDMAVNASKQSFAKLERAWVQLVTAGHKLSNPSRDPNMPFMMLEALVKNDLFTPDELNAAFNCDCEAVYRRFKKSDIYELEDSYGKIEKDLEQFRQQIELLNSQLSEKDLLVQELTIKVKNAEAMLDTVQNKIAVDAKVAIVPSVQHYPNVTMRRNDLRRRIREDLRCSQSSLNNLEKKFSVGVARTQTRESGLEELMEGEVRSELGYQENIPLMSRRDIARELPIPPVYSGDENKVKFEEFIKLFDWKYGHMPEEPRTILFHSNFLSGRAKQKFLDLPLTVREGPFDELVDAFRDAVGESPVLRMTSSLDKLSKIKKAPKQTLSSYCTELERLSNDCYGNENELSVARAQHLLGQLTMWEQYPTLVAEHHRYANDPAAVYDSVKSLALAVESARDAVAKACLNGDASMSNQKWKHRFAHPEAQNSSNMLEQRSSDYRQDKSKQWKKKEPQMSVNSISGKVEKEVAVSSVDLKPSVDSTDDEVYSTYFMNWPGLECYDKDNIEPNMQANSAVVHGINTRLYGRYNLDGKWQKCLIDSGSDVSLLTVEMANRVKESRRCVSVKTYEGSSVISASGDEIKLREQVVVVVRLRNNKRRHVKFLVRDSGLDEVIIGSDAFESLGIKVSIDGRCTKLSEGKGEMSVKHSNSLIPKGENVVKGAMVVTSDQSQKKVEVQNGLAFNHLRVNVHSSCSSKAKGQLSRKETAAKYHVDRKSTGTEVSHIVTYSPKQSSFLKPRVKKILKGNQGHQDVPDSQSPVGANSEFVDHGWSRKDVSRRHKIVRRQFSPEERRVNG